MLEQIEECILMFNKHQNKLDSITSTDLCKDYEQTKKKIQELKTQQDTVLKRLETILNHYFEDTLKWYCRKIKVKNHLESEDIWDMIYGVQIEFPFFYNHDCRQYHCLISLFEKMNKENSCICYHQCGRHFYVYNPFCKTRVDEK